MNGALPPSSRETFLMSLAHSAINWRPISVEPVNDSLRTIGLLVSSPQMSPALPVTTLSTPCGMPARWASLTRARAENGVCEAGLITMVQAAARSEEQTSELQSLMRIAYAVFGLNKQTMP